MAIVLVGLILPPILAGGFLDLTTTPKRTVVSISLTLAEQILIVTTGFVLKPLYQIISFVIVIMLWKETALDLSALRRGMIAFVIGENACALNYLLFNERSLFLEFFHTYGMLVCFGLVSYALMEAFDKRVFNFSNPSKKCVLLPLCRECYKYSNARCNLRLLFLFVIPSTAVMAALPLTASLGGTLYIGNVFGSHVIFGHSLLLQIIEVRYYPLLSLAFFGLSFLVLLSGRGNGFESSKVFYAMGIGPLGFSLMRFFFFWGYRENPLWADAWEEITEFLFIAFVLWIVIRIRSVSKQLYETKFGR